MNAPKPATTTQQLSSITRVTVGENDRVGALVPGMPVVASTPYGVAVAKMACGWLVKDPLQVVIDRPGPSKVGAQLVIKAALVNREKNRLHFAVEVEDGARTVAKIEHESAAVSLEKIMKAVG